MRGTSMLLLMLAIGAAAAEPIDLRSQKAMTMPDRLSWSEQPYSVLSTMLASDAQKACPAGFEKVREYAAPEGDAWHLHFVIRCLPPATPSASGPSESR